MRREAPILAALLALAALTPGVAGAQDDKPPAPPPPEEAPEEPKRPLELRAVADQNVRETRESGDLAAVGETVTSAGLVGDNAFLAGNTVSVEKEIGGDLFAAAEKIRVVGVVRGDVYAFGRSLVIAEGARVGGHIFFAGESFELAGTAFGLHIAAAKVGIAGTVTGDAELDAVEFSLDGRIDGDLSYRAPRELELDKSRVGGELRYRRPPARPSRGDDDLEVASFLGLLLLSLFGQLMIGAVLFFACPALVQLPSERLRAQPGRALGIGFIISLTLMALTIPALVLAGCGLAIGMVMNFLGSGALWFAAYFLSSFATAACLGRWVAARFLGRSPGEGFGPFAFGLALLHIVGLIPFLGVLVHMGAAFAGIGGSFLALRAAGPVEKGVAG